MLRSFIKIAWRNVLKNRLYSVVNVTGLAVGLASFIVILVYLNYELSYDKWDTSLKRVYKISMQEDKDILRTTPAPLADLLLQKYPAAEAATSCMPAGNYEVLMSAGDKKIYQPGLVTTDSLFFKVFPYKLRQGNIATALNQPNAIVLSDEVNRKLFGNTNSIGKTVKLYNAVDCVVTGIMQAPDGPSHLDVQMVMRDPYGHQNKDFWQNYSYQTYIKLKQPVATAKVEEVINRIYYDAQLKKGSTTLEEYRKAGNQTALFADEVANLHNFPKHGESNFKTTIVLLILAVFLLIAGAINFSNLSVAKAITRAREVGIRKVLGSRKGHIIVQSLFEIAIQCFISLVLAILLVNIMLPYFSSSFNVPLSLLNTGNIVSICLQIAGSLLAIVVVAGLYPALFLSNFQTADVLKGKFARGNKGVFFRNGLLVVQLTLSALFITGIIVINRQMSFMQHKDLGFNPSQVIRITATQQNREGKFPLVQNTLLSIPGVEYVSKSTTVPGDESVDTSTNEYKFAGNKYRFNGVKVGVDYFRVMNVKLLQGRFFENNHPEDLDNTAIINESALKELGVADATGQRLIFPYCDSIPYTIVGIVKDFNVQGMQSHVVPTVYSISNAHCGYRSGGAILVKINTKNVKQTLSGIEAAWKKLEPDFPIRYSFLDENFQKLFSDYERLGKVIFFFSIISILIAVTGLFALTSFLAQQRVKEIGVRKVLGASVSGITALLSKDFIKLVIAAIIIATPVAWWALSKWLNEFAYRINLTWWMFALAGVLMVCITLITVCSQAIKAAMANPVESLRTE
ncbi:MAG TPA: ABC transporter permease [Chitinophagaceae bacterium]|nr:ABC transporter permease [Chitinophagaceae bacterium]